MGFGNRLARVLKPGATTEYAYDSQDRRTVVIEDGVMTRNLWSGSDEVGEYDAAGGLKRRFIPDGSGSMDARLATVNPDGTVYWRHTDHQRRDRDVRRGAAAGPASYELFRRDPASRNRAYAHFANEAGTGGAGKGRATPRQKRTLVHSGTADFDDCEPRTKCGTKRSVQAAIAVSGW